ncbi:uroporphyrinogen-III C-methyltransferase [Pyrofollis japonicus]|uniref:uroporphyrinogen-III C-methyltransferase n=1 Tax=Pyrofollis japonicus TaxID=3060460 RepID=UPI00295B0B25|nr:uroporphyrinogen-III C-methyltransferase [Pyrofollis japonicus]BEP17722.1 uroporphyrinogen-III C-methyltransferase [Pyrofollis japonicus]
MQGAGKEGCRKGKVYIVGAGPGDPELLTLKAVRIIRSADVIVYDRLAPTDFIKREAKSDAELIYAGKAPGRHAMSQDEINKLLEEKACEGKLVARIHGGDPFLFGRGEEECIYLASRGISCEVVPGITSAIAGPELACIPPTSRLVASSVAIVPGREAAERKERRVYYGRIAKTVDTMIVLMGVGRLSEIVNELLEEGLDPSTPVAIVENASLPNQRVVVGRLANIVSKAREANVKPPAVIIVGKVVWLRDKICPETSR